MIIEHKNDYWNVLKTQHVKPGKGGAFNQVELKSVIKGTKLNERFRSSETVEKAEVEEKKFNFLYIDGENCHFMDNTNFEQVEISDRESHHDYVIYKKWLPCVITPNICLFIRKPTRNHTLDYTQRRYESLRGCSLVRLY